MKCVTGARRLARSRLISSVLERQRRPSTVSDTSKPALVSVVVVTYNSARHIASCLESLAGNERLMSVVVVDNASTDATAEIIGSKIPSMPWPVNFIQTGVNLGFGRAVNRGVASLPMANQYVCILNPDTVVGVAALDRLASYLDTHQHVALVGPRVQNPDGSTYASVRSFPNPLVALGHAFGGILWPNNPVSRRYRSTDPESPDWVSGTVMMVRRDAFEQVSGFDERYFMYVEDLDLCWRLRAAGWQIGFCSLAEVTHEIGGSGIDSRRRLVIEHHRSAWQFAKASSTGTKRVLLPFYGLALLGRLTLVMLGSWVGRRYGGPGQPSCRVNRNEGPLD